jgi:hypothetical protein
MATITTCKDNTLAGSGSCYTTCELCSGFGFTQSCDNCCATGLLVVSDWSQPENPTARRTIVCKFCGGRGARPLTVQELRSLGFAISRIDALASFHRSLAARKKAAWRDKVHGHSVIQ